MRENIKTRENIKMRENIEMLGIKSLVVGNARLVCNGTCAQNTE